MCSDILQCVVWFVVGLGFLVFQLFEVITAESFNFRDVFFSSGKFSYLPRLFFYPLSPLPIIMFLDLPPDKPFIN